MPKYLLPAAIAGLIGLAFLSAGPAHAYPGEQQYGPQAKIGLDQARAIALKVFPGRIVSEELEKEGGGSGLRYSFDVSNGNSIHEVGVDAETGKVLENSVDTDFVRPENSSSVGAPAAMVPLPGGSQGIDFDDMRYFPQLKKVAVPAAQTGDLELIDPDTYAVTVIPDVASKQAAPNGDDPGSTSVAYGEGHLFAGDHVDESVSIVDPAAKRVVGHVKLAADYDFVRYLPLRHELWVTEPGKHQIEIFKLTSQKPLSFKHESTIHVSDGPEALVFDESGNRAYTDERSGTTVAIDLSKLQTVGRWSNGCQQSRGLARDGHWLFVACREGAVSVLDTAHDGRKIAELPTGEGVDLIAYDSAHNLLFVPGAKSATLTVAQVRSDGRLQPMATYKTVAGAHCVAASGNGKAFVCDPRQGQIIVIVPKLGG